MTSDEQKWLSVPTFLRLNKGVIGRSSLYDLIREERIDVLRISQRKFLIRNDCLDRLYASELDVETN